MMNCGRIKEILDDEKMVNRIIRDIVAGEFRIELTLDQIETCFMMSIEKYFDVIIVKQPVSKNVFNLYLDGKKYMEENYYALVDQIVGSEDYINNQLERDMKDIWALNIVKVKAVDFDMDRVICISQDMNLLNQLKLEINEAQAIEDYSCCYEY